MLDYVEYNFDAEGMITYLTVYTELVGVIDEEIFVRQNDMIYSVYFSNPSKWGYTSSVTSLTRCIFDDLGYLVQYDVANLVHWFCIQDQMPFKLHEALELTNELRTECYRYCEGKLSEFELISFYPHIGLPPKYEVVSFQTNSKDEILHYDVFNTVSKRVQSHQPKKPYQVRNSHRTNLFKYDNKNQDN